MLFIECGWCLWRHKDHHEHYRFLQRPDDWLYVFCRKCDKWAPLLMGRQAKKALRRLPAQMVDAPVLQPCTIHLSSVNGEP